MINKTLVKKGSENSKIEFWCAKVTDTEKELSITVIQNENQFDFDFNTHELDELIDYLEDMTRHIKDFKAINK